MNDYRMKGISADWNSARLCGEGNKTIRIDSAKLIEPKNTWRINFSSMLLFSPTGKRIKLTSHQATIIDTLLRTPNKVVPKKALFQALNKNYIETDDGVLYQCIKRLRKTAREVLGDDLPLQTHRPNGYVFYTRD